MGLRAAQDVDEIDGARAFVDGPALLDAEREAPSYVTV